MLKLYLKNLPEIQMLNKLFHLYLECIKKILSKKMRKIYENESI